MDGEIKTEDNNESVTIIDPIVESKPLSSEIIKKIADQYDQLIDQPYVLNATEVQPGVVQIVSAKGIDKSNPNVSVEYFNQNGVKISTNVTDYSVALNKILSTK